MVGSPVQIKWRHTKCQAEHFLIRIRFSFHIVHYFSDWVPSSLSHSRGLDVPAFVLWRRHDREQIRYSIPISKNQSRMNFNFPKKINGITGLLARDEKYFKQIYSFFGRKKIVDKTDTVRRQVYQMHSGLK